MRVEQHPRLSSQKLPGGRRAAGREDAAYKFTIAQRDETIAQRDQTIADLRIRLSLALAGEVHGKASLEVLFGTLKDLGVDPQCHTHRYSAQTGYALVEVSPTGRVLVSDPRGNVRAIEIAFDPYGNFSTDDLRAVDAFLGQVMFSREVGRGPVTELCLTKPQSSDTNAQPGGEVAVIDLPGTE